MTVTVLTTEGERRGTAAPGESLHACLARMGAALAAPCGGAGVCGKCRVRLLAGSVTGTAPDADGYVLSCRAYPVGDVVVEAGEEVAPFTVRGAAAGKGASGYGVAVDVGTTTLEARLVDLASGETLARDTRFNPQSVWGTDVLSRVRAAEHGETQRLAAAVRGAVSEVTDGWRETFGIRSYKRVAVCGNTVMLHLFAGVNPAPLGKYPFTPIFTEERKLSGQEAGLAADEVALLPAASAFIGADLVAGAAAEGLTAGGPALLLDVGTNGEAALWTGKELLCCSAAAGPAFEGAGISCGMGGVPGAVCRVRLAGGDLALTTVEGAPPRGLCGAGLTDLAAVLLAAGALHPSGRLSPESAELPAVAARMAPEGVRIAPGVALTQEDVRALQTAKSAVRASVELLVKRAGLVLGKIQRVLLAGGLGSAMSVRSAIAIGLLPHAFLEKTSAVGNAAARGTAEYLLREEARQKLRETAQACRTVELGGDPEFEGLFVRFLSFPENA